MTLTSRTYSVARFRFTKPILRPETSSQTRIRSPIGRMGVSDCTSSSLSILRRLRLSRMVTSWPRSDRYSDVGQPQNPSPPRTRTRIPTPVTLRWCEEAKRPKPQAWEPVRLSQIGPWRPGAPIFYLPLACHDVMAPTRPVWLDLMISLAAPGRPLLDSTHAADTPPRPLGIGQTDAMEWKLEVVVLPVS